MTPGWLAALLLAVCALAPQPLEKPIEVDGTVVTGWIDGKANKVAIDVPDQVLVVSVSIDTWLELLHDRRQSVHVRATEDPSGAWHSITVQMTDGGLPRPQSPIARAVM
jgi:hypothetical protein